jgi:argininosuccinate synthase
VKDRIVLAYSGSLETAVAIPWLAERHAADIVTMTLDLGAGGDLQEVRERAMAAGAVRAHVLDARDEFLRDHVLPATQTGSLCHPQNPIPASLAHPLIAGKLVDIAAIERASAVAHGCRAAASAFDAVALNSHPAVRVLAPVRDWRMTDQDVIDYARSRNLPVRAGLKAGSYTVPVGADLQVGPHDAAGEAAVEITFDAGVPVAISGIPMPLAELFESLAIIAAQHGIHPASRFQDAPAAVVLRAAHAALTASNHLAVGERPSGVVRLTLVNGALRISDLAALRS